MKRLLFAFAVIGALSVASARAALLPNGCASLASQANAELAKSAVWSQVLFIKFIDVKTLEVLGHALTVWQIHEGGAVLVYDHHGTFDLATHSREVNDIVAALNKIDPLQPIIEAHFIQ